VTYQDKQITCGDCGRAHSHHCERQEFFSSKGYTNEPKRCLTCRQKPGKSQRVGADGEMPDQDKMFLPPLVLGVARQTVKCRSNLVRGNRFIAASASTQ